MPAQPLASFSSPDNGEQSPTPEQLLTDLRGLIKDLGKGGGLSNGSVYDTAMVVRLAPPEKGTADAVKWLLSKRDLKSGGWESMVPRSGDLPTLAAVFALYVRRKDDPKAEKDVMAAVQEGLGFLRKQAPHWTVLPEDLLVGVEMNLLRLLEELELELKTKKELDGLMTSEELEALKDQYKLVIADGRRRREKFQAIGSSNQMQPGTPLALTWEGWGWGTKPDPKLMDPTGGVGPSPAATAAWIHAASQYPELKEHVARAREYLRKAAETGTDVGKEGVVPATWPIDYMEQQWGLFALYCAGLFGHEKLKEVVKPHLDALKEAFNNNNNKNTYGIKGIGFTKHFMPDGDCTAVTLLLLKAWEQVSDSEKASDSNVDMSVLKQYERKTETGRHFLTYPMETHPSLTTTAHAVMALNIVKENRLHWVESMIKLQSLDRRWIVDKWQTSWLYTTTQVMFAISKPEQLLQSIKNRLHEQLRQSLQASLDHASLQPIKESLDEELLQPIYMVLHEQLLKSTNKLLVEQNKDGSWGSTALETAWAVLALLHVKAEFPKETQAQIHKELKKANEYLHRNYQKTKCGCEKPMWNEEPTWIGKALYCPFRMDQAFALSAMVALALAKE